MRISYLRYIIVLQLFTIYTLSTEAQDASRCARVVAGRDTITDSVWYFTRSVEVRLIPPVSGSIMHYTLDGSQPGLQSPRYARPLLLSASAVLNYLTLESERKETLCPALSFRRIAGVESISIFSKTFKIFNGQALSLFDSLSASPPVIPARLTRISMEINRGIVTRVDSVGLWFHDNLISEIRSIKISFSSDGKRFSQPVKYKFSVNKGNGKGPLTIKTDRREFRYLKMEWKLKKLRHKPYRTFPLRLIRFFDTPEA